MSATQQITVVNKAIALLEGHAKALSDLNNGKTVNMTLESLCLVMGRLTETAKDAGLNTEAMLVIMYMHGKERVTLNELKEVGVVNKNITTLGAAFRHGSLNVADVTTKENSGCKVTGKFFTLNAIGNSLAESLTRAVKPAKK